MGAPGDGWVEQAAREGAAVSADPGESGDPAAAPPNPEERTFRTGLSDPAPGEPSNRITGGGESAEGGAAEDGGVRSKIQADQAEPPPSNHLTGGGDPVEGKR